MSELLGLEECPDAETIVKGLLTTDIQEGEIRRDLFKGRESSYSRLAVYTIEKILDIFRTELPRPPEKLLVGYCILNVGQMKRLGAAFKNRDVPEGISVKVVPVPLPACPPHPQNDSHAETRPNITLGLSAQFAKEGGKQRVDFSRPSG